MEGARTLLRQEIQRELKIKEAAERMRRAVTNRKNAADVEGQLKASSRRLEKLHWELQELNARSMATERDSTTGNQTDYLLMWIFDKMAALDLIVSTFKHRS